jgi:hypothetical protein
MPVVFAQRGMTTLGKSLNVSQLSADPWEKFLRCSQAGFASCNFFFFPLKQFKRDNPTEWAKAFGPCPGLPKEEAVLGAQATPTLGRTFPRWLLEGQDPPLFVPCVPDLVFSGGTNVPEAAHTGLGIVPLHLCREPPFTWGMRGPQLFPHLGIVLRLDLAFSSCAICR